jgi:hypothetical protein
MKRIISSIVAAAVMLSAASAGAQTSPTAYDRVEHSREFWAKYTRGLPIGSTVRVRTTDGQRFTAVLAIVDDTGVTLQPKTRVPEKPRHVPFEKLDQLELRQNGSSLGKAVGIGVGVGVGAFFGMLAILAASWD